MLQTDRKLAIVEDIADVTSRSQSASPSSSSSTSSLSRNQQQSSAAAVDPLCRSMLRLKLDAVRKLRSW